MNGTTFPQTQLNANINIRQIRIAQLIRNLFLCFKKSNIKIIIRNKKKIFKNII